MSKELHTSKQLAFTNMNTLAKISLHVVGEKKGITRIRKERTSKQGSTFDVQIGFHAA